MSEAFFSWGNGGWGEVHKKVRTFSTPDELGDRYVEGACGCVFKAHHTADRVGPVTCSECAKASPVPLGTGDVPDHWEPHIRREVERLGGMP